MLPNQEIQKSKNVRLFGAGVKKSNGKYYVGGGRLFYIIGSAFFGLITSELLGLKAYRKYAIFSIIQRILMVGLSIGLYFLIGIDGIIMGIGLSFIPFVYRIFTSLKESKINFSFLKTKLPFMMNAYTLDLRGAFAGSMDKLIIVPFLGFFALGNYQLGIQIFSIN